LRGVGTSELARNRKGTATCAKPAPCVRLAFAAATGRAGGAAGARANRQEPASRQAVCWLLPVLRFKTGSLCCGTGTAVEHQPKQGSGGWYVKRRAFLCASHSQLLAAWLLLSGGGGRKLPSAHSSQAQREKLRASSFWEKKAQQTTFRSCTHPRKGVPRCVCVELCVELSAVASRPAWLEAGAVVKGVSTLAVRYPAYSGRRCLCVELALVNKPG